jgi:DNA modification methylase
MRTVTCKIKEYIQPFERHLALQELRAVAGADPQPIDGGMNTAARFQVLTRTTPKALRSALAYWESVGQNPLRPTIQISKEAASLIARNGLSLAELPTSVPDIVDSVLPNKRCLRYATHGLHEYRGKFFPQLVKALMNLAQVPRKGIVLDPMCGSGTTLVESILSGRAGYGLDLNPLSVFVSRVKCDALKISPSTLIRSFSSMSDRVRRPLVKSAKPGYFESLARADQEYCRKWFSVSTILELDHIMEAIQELRSSSVRDFYRLCLSNILRGVSWQKEDDLRIRKEVRRLSAGQVVERFVAEALRSAKSVAAFNSLIGSESPGNYFVSASDARETQETLPSLIGKVDVIITSPPYATALPYLDTDRLSLVYLGLLSRPEHRRYDLLMIGNREVTDRGRRAYWELYRANVNALPAETRSLIDRIDRLNSNGKVGFRRRNLSALLAKYFLDMREVLSQQYGMLRPRGTMYMVIGNNRTTAGGEEVEIETAKHLGQIAETIGFQIDARIPMEMLVSRDIFRNNAMPSEQILSLRKRQ